MKGIDPYGRQAISVISFRIDVGIDPYGRQTITVIPVGQDAHILPPFPSIEELFGFGAASLRFSLKTPERFGGFSYICVEFHGGIWYTLYDAKFSDGGRYGIRQRKRRI